MHVVQLPDEFNMDIQKKMNVVSAIMICPYCKAKLLNFSQNKLVKRNEDLTLSFKEVRKELGFFKALKIFIFGDKKEDYHYATTACKCGARFRSDLYKGCLKDKPLRDVMLQIQFDDLQKKFDKMTDREQKTWKLYWFDCKWEFKHPSQGYYYNDGSYPIEPLSLFKKEEC